MGGRVCWGNYMARNIIEMEGVSRSFGDAFHLKVPRLTVPRGRITVLRGESGSGKTVLMNMLGLLEPPDPDALDGAQIAVHDFPGETTRRLAETALYPPLTEAATG